tara:strand:+ start:851 stop:988 length:138 start_codon:yes stop_codon:yes gene_type:complete
MKAVRFWIELAKHILDGWNTVSADLGYTPFDNKQTKNKVNTADKI